MSDPEGEVVPTRPPQLTWAVFLTISAALMHGLNVQEHLSEWWGYGVLFLFAVTEILRAVSRPGPEQVANRSIKATFRDGKVHGIQDPPLLKTPFIAGTAVSPYFRNMTTKRTARSRLLQIRTVRPRVKASGFSC